MLKLSCLALGLIGMLLNIQPAYSQDKRGNTPSASEGLLIDDAGHGDKAGAPRQPFLMDDRSAKARGGAGSSYDDTGVGDDSGSNDAPIYEDFAKYILDTSGKVVTDALPFRQSKVRSPKLSESYVLGTGDRIEIQVWGSISAQYHLSLDKDGRVFIPDVGSLQLAGLKASELTSVLQAHFRKIYKGFELRAVVDAARVSHVTVTGYAKGVGVLSIPATHTLLSAAQTFAQPAAGGSRRFVEFQRKGGSTQRIDLYCLLKGQCKDIPDVLQDGDVIRVPRRSKLVAINGAVARPGIYELQQDESPGDLFDYAGGMTLAANQDRINIQTFATGRPNDRLLTTVTAKELCVADSALPTLPNCPKLAEGDYIEVPTKLAWVQNAVSIVAEGVDTVKLQYVPGMHLLDALNGRLELMIPERVLQSLNSGQFAALTDLDTKLKALDLHSITVYRFDKAPREFRPLMVNVEQAKADPSGPANLTLQDGDVIVIDNNDDSRTPRANLSTSVRIMGEVARPGRYRYVGTKTLSDALQMAGGATSGSAMWNAVILRQTDVRNAVGRTALDLALKTITDYQARQEAVNSDGKTDALAAKGASVDALSRKRGINLEVQELLRGRSIVYIGGNSDTQNKLMLLDPNDILIIPAQQTTYSCEGSFFHVGDIFIPESSTLSLDEATARCGSLEELKPQIYHFIARENRVCKPGWWTSCPPVRNGDLLLAVPEAVRRQGSTAEWLDTTLRTLTALATLKVLAN